MLPISIQRNKAQYWKERCSLLWSIRSLIVRQCAVAYFLELSTYMRGIFLSNYTYIAVQDSVITLLGKKEKIWYRFGKVSLVIPGR